MHIATIPTDMVGLAWPKVAALVAASCRRSPEPVTPDELRACCEAGRARLLFVMDGDALAAIGIVQIYSHEGRTVCGILACAGSGMRAWLDTLREVEAWGRYHGATSLRFAGRPGWARVLPGYRVLGAHLTKDL